MSTPPEPQAATPRVSPSGSPEEAQGATAITLPVLDALLGDQGFRAKLKAELQLSDDQITQLRNVAHQYKPAAGTGDTGSTSAAKAAEEQQVASVIGPQKEQRLELIARDYWTSAAGDENATKTGSDATGSETSNASSLEPTPVNEAPGDTRILVNIPAYRMDIFDQGRLIKSYKIGIGYPEFPLPTGMRQAKTIIFNPSWTPPDEPWVTSANKVRAGEKIAPGSSLNPLGPIKIPIGLPSLIHGGKSPAKLGGFASHGCVGLTTAQVTDFALKLAAISGSDLSPEQIAGYEKRKSETRTVKLKSLVPVELRYQTIVVEDGKLHIYRDVYDAGANTEGKLRAVLNEYGVSMDQLTPAERNKAVAALQAMARDPAGKTEYSVTAGNSSPDASDGLRPARNKKKKGDAHVTRGVSGRKEMVVEIAALSGKGYPAPVNLDSGTGAGSRRKMQPSPNQPAKETQSSAESQTGTGTEVKLDKKAAQSETPRLKDTPAPKTGVTPDATSTPNPKAKPEASIQRSKQENTNSGPP